MEPWEKISETSERVGFRKLLRKFFHLPDGKEGEFVIKDEGETVAILALTGDGNVLLTEQFRPGPERVLHELPGGFVDQDESPETAAARELLEETGYTGELIYAGKNFVCGYSNRVKHAFLAVDCRPTDEQRLETAEFIHVFKASMEDFRTQLQTGELTDSDCAYRALEVLNTLT